MWAEVLGVIELIVSASIPVPNDIEKELNLSHIQKTDWEYMNVRIKTELITDSSLKSSFTAVTVPNSTYAEFIARQFLKLGGKKVLKNIQIFILKMTFKTLWFYGQMLEKAETLKIGEGSTKQHPC